VPLADVGPGAVDFVLGGNVPWIDCGWDFGPPPHGFSRPAPRDYGRVARELGQLRASGLHVVRWWILAGGTNYPVGRGIERVAEAQRCRTGVQFHLREGVVPPALGDDFLADFAALLEACRAAGVRLLPSLLSFEWFLPATRYSRGRSALVFGVDPRRTRARVIDFLDATLGPLVEVARAHAQAVYAFEVINEPDWVTEGGPWLGPGFGRRRIAAHDMNALLSEAVERIVDAGLTATIGFKDMRASWLGPRLYERLRALGRAGRYVHQMHHYPNVLGEGTLPPASLSAVQPVIVGEMPTARGQLWRVRPRPSFGENLPWLDRELMRSERDPERFLTARIALTRQRGYTGALLWATPLAQTSPGRDTRADWRVGAVSELLHA